MTSTLFRNARLLALPALMIFTACGAADATPRDAVSSPTPFRVLKDAPGFDFLALSQAALGTGTAAEIISQTPGRVLVGVYHGTCDHFSVDGSRHGVLDLTITTVIPDGEFCPAAGEGSVLDVDVPDDGGPYTLRVSRR